MAAKTCALPTSLVQAIGMRRHPEVTHDLTLIRKELGRGVNLLRHLHPLIRRVNDEDDPVLPQFLEAVGPHRDVAKARICNEYSAVRDAFDNNKMIKSLQSDRNDDRSLLTGQFVHRHIAKTLGGITAGLREMLHI